MASANSSLSAGPMPRASSWATNSLIFPDFIALDSVNILESLGDFMSLA